MANNFAKYPYSIIKVGGRFFGIMEKKTKKLILKPTLKEGEKEKPLLFNSFNKALEEVKQLNESKKFIKKPVENNKLKTFQVHITQTVEQDYEIKARSEQEAKQIADDRYMNAEIDPIRDDGDISHSVRLLNEGLEKEKDKYFTKQGYEVLGHFLDQESGRTHIIGKREAANDYFIGLGYDISEGTWAQGRYDFKNFKDALENLKSSYKVEELNERAVEWLYMQQIDRITNKINLSSEKEPSAKKIDLLKSKIKELEKDNIYLTELDIAYSLNWLQKDCASVEGDREFIKKHEEEIFEMAHELYYKADTGAYVNNADTAVCAAYLSYKTVENTNIKAYDIYDSMMSNGIFDGSDENSTVALDRFDREEILKDYLSEIEDEKENKKNMKSNDDLEL